MSDEKKLPKRRFKQFLNTPSWEQRKLCEVAEITMGQSPSSKNYTDNPKDFILVQGNADLKNGAVVPRLWTKEVTKTAEANSIILTVRAPVGEVAISDYDVVLGRGVAGIKGNEFIYYVLLYLKEFHYWEKLSSGSTFDSINSNDIREILINIPSEKEQDAITSQLKGIDNLITLHQRKLNKLEKLKKAYLEELFPTGNQCKPKRRFKEFKDDWEQRKLTDISKTFIGLVTTMTTNYREAGTLLVRNSDIRDNKFIFSEKPIYLDSEFAKSNESRKLKSGDVVTVHTGDIGTSAVVEEDIEGAIGFATINTRPDINYLDPHFLSTYFNTERHKKYAISVATGDGRSNYNIKDFNKLMLYMPSINEQKAIAEFIKRITDLITLHQRKLEKLKKLKTAYLDELFV